MLTHRFPYPPDRGDRIRSYHLLRVLAREFNVTLGAIADEPVSASQQQHIEGLCEQVVIGQPGKIERLLGAAKSVARRRSITEGMFASGSLMTQITQFQNRNPFDRVVVFCSSMFRYVDTAGFRGTRIVVDLVDVDSRKWEQLGRENRFPKSLVFRREADRVQCLEQRIADTVDAVVLVSADEAALYRETVDVPDSQTVLGVSNGVDTEYFRPTRSRTRAEFDGDPPRAELSAISATTTPLRLVFTGVMNYSPNVSGMEWFCREVLPALQKRIDVSLKIVGRSPNAQAQLLDRLSGVEVVGEVPDVRPYLSEADIAISPLKLARGIQNKVLEAMAIGCPVVCTSQSAQGIDGEDGIHFVIADTVEDWCRALTELHLDQDRCQRLLGAARHLVVSAYSWSARLGPILQLLNPSSQPQPVVEVAQTSGTT